MHLLELARRPTESLRYLEENVNAGSPSGFTAVNQPSRKFAPGSSPAPFTLYSCHAQSDRAISTFGQVPDLPHAPASVSGPGRWIYVHPDVSAHTDLSHETCCRLDSPLVVPTASGRTVQLVSQSPDWYIKLSYPKTLGRVNRALPRRKAVAGPELSVELEGCLQRGLLPPEFHILREIGSRTLTTSNRAEWSMVVREPWATGSLVAAIHALIPFFSLIAADPGEPKAPLLLWQLVGERADSEAADLIWETVIRPVLDSYFCLVTTRGLQAEINAQNILLAVDAEAKPVGIVLRDLMGIEKDLTVRRDLGLTCVFASEPYKCIERDSGPDHYAIRHSFAFDFKLGEYVLYPVIAAISRKVPTAADRLVTVVRDYMDEVRPRLPEAYFPARVWYSHPNQLLTDQRPYIEHRDPRFRRY